MLPLQRCMKEYNNYFYNISIYHNPVNIYRISILCRGRIVLIATLQRQRCNVYLLACVCSGWCKCTVCVAQMYCFFVEIVWAREPLVRGRKVTYCYAYQRLNTEKYFPREGENFLSRGRKNEP